MKKFILLVLLLVLTVSLLAGCRSGNNAESMIDDASSAVDDVMPNASNGQATDGDGMIDDTGRTERNGGSGQMRN